jgi:hypothetical protein
VRRIEAKQQSAPRYDGALNSIGNRMAFKQTKGNMTVEACVFPAPGQMFKGALRVTTTRDSKTLQQITGRGCGRPMRSSDAALAELEARRILGL